MLYYATTKGKLIHTLATARNANGEDFPWEMPDELCGGAACPGPIWELCPTAFAFHPSKRERNPYLALRAAYEEDDPPCPWIIKPSDGTKGQGIRIAGSWRQIEGHLRAMSSAVACGENIPTWVVQRYLPNPLLLRRGSRKFDLRCWAALDPAYNVHLYGQGVLRTSAVAYDPNDLQNTYSHLTNHCIAATHEDYGMYEETNELFYAAFDAELGQRFPGLAAAVGGSVLRAVILPQVRRIVVQTFIAAREQLEYRGEAYRPFQLFGFDFLIDTRLRVWLCEVNAYRQYREHAGSDGHLHTKRTLSYAYHMRR